MQSYFSVKRNILGRFFFIFGKTNDCFCGNNLIDVNLEFTLNEHLRQEGYRRVIFYSKTQKIHCYDKESFKFTKNPKAKLSDGNDKTVKRAPMLLKGPLSSRMAPPVRKVDEPAETDDILHFGKMTELDAFNRIDFCMKDRNIKTAVVFTNADDFINYFGEVQTQAGGASIRSKIFDSLNIYGSLDHTNYNIALFVFPHNSLCDAVSVYNKSGGTAWSTFIEPRLKSSTVINIDPPAIGEIRNAINHTRIKYGLNVDFTFLEDICRRIARTYYADKLPLKQLMMELKEFAEKKQMLDNESCGAICGKQNKETAFNKLDKLIGMENVKKEIRMLKSRAEKSERIVKNADFSSRLLPPQTTANEQLYNLHCVITGNPGTGKTTTAKLLGEIYYELGYLDGGHTVKVTRNDLVAGYVGQTAIKTSEQIERAMGGVLFIDEAYTLARSDENSDFGQEAIDTILEAMSDRNGRFAVVAAGYPEEMEKFINSNPGLKRRFGKVIHIDDYSAEELLDIFNMNLTRQKYSVCEELFPLLTNFFENWHRSRDENWGNAGNVENLIEHMYGNWCARDGRKGQNGWPLLEMCDIPAELQAHCKPISQAKKDAMDKLNSLIGLGKVKEKINELRRTIKYAGKSPEPGHYIFAGNPGTGKTTVARLLGDIFCEIGVLRRGHVIEVSREDLVGEHVGETAIKTKKQLEKALDGILFIDEAYRLYEQSDSHNYGKESIDTILAFMENNRDRLCVICAGYTDQMDKFIKSNEGLRSRFSESIIFDDYNTEELLQILRSFNESKGFASEQTYIEKSKLVFDFWTKNKGKDFGNGRDVRNYAKECENALYKRLDFEYKNSESVPESVKKTLTGDDIPDKYAHCT